MDEREAGAAGEVEAGGKAGGAEHGDEGHAVHVVGDGFAGGEAEAAPAFALGCLEASEEVEEGDWRGLRRCRAVGKGGKD